MKIDWKKENRSGADGGMTLLGHFLLSAFSQRPMDPTMDSSNVDFTIRVNSVDIDIPELFKSWERKIDHMKTQAKKEGYDEALLGLENSFDDIVDDFKEKFMEKFESQD